MLYFPDTQPTQPLITTACQPFPAVATHAKVSPFFAAVMRLYCVPLPVRMLTVPLTQECIDRADAVTVLSHEYTKSCLFARNRYLVTQVDILLACFDGKEGGTKNTVEYAQRNGCRVCLIPPVKKECRYKEHNAATQSEEFIGCPKS